MIGFFLKKVLFYIILTLPKPALIQTCYHQKSKLIPNVKGSKQGLFTLVSVLCLGLKTIC